MKFIYKLNLLVLKSIFLVVFVSFLNIVKADFCFKTFNQDSIEAKVIFVGKVLEIERGAYWSNGYPKTIFYFEVLESFKGLIYSTRYLSLIGPLNGCCNIHYKLDSTFLVFAYTDCEDSRILWTNDCSNTGLLSKREEVYNRLPNKIVHTTNLKQLKYLSYRNLFIDSLKTEIIDLNKGTLELNKIKKRYEKYFIVIILFFLVALLYISTIKKP